jgi:hypothetical protein
MLVGLISYDPQFTSLSKYNPEARGLRFGGFLSLFTISGFCFIFCLSKSCEETILPLIISHSTLTCGTNVLGHLQPQTPMLRSLKLPCSPKAQTQPRLQGPCTSVGASAPCGQPSPTAGNMRRAWSRNLHVGARERLESLMLTRRSTSDLSSLTQPTRRAPCVVWTSLGPLPRWVPGPTTRWAPGTSQLALHGT